MQRLGLDIEGLGEVLAVVGLFNQMNRLADAYQVEPDVLPNTGEGNNQAVKPTPDRRRSSGRRPPANKLR